ncbi:hypothetical protein INT46_001964 [Mucor plumbeus]|uniref:Transposase Tc1-like domain-containing protein n=1 Tax=Mucor plumbeus TaxID=97098 RepID=A0A8H7V8Y3_9FUNG|nr:hypothetical protein INT46_001964 [Mucor plumbeus]
MKSILDNKRNDVLSLLNSGDTVAKIVCRVRVSKAIVCGGLGNAIQAKEELSHSLKINVSADTVRRTLKNHGLGALPKVKKPDDISNDNAKERLLWCKDRIDWTLDNWKRVIFTDELRVNCFNLNG